MKSNGFMSKIAAPPTIPPRMRSRPTDPHRRGLPVPWFVTEKDDNGRWDFRFLHPARRDEAVRRRVCWMCGQPLGRYKASLIGPTSFIDRVITEPPGHKDCSLYAVRVCPFLAHPAARRRRSGLPKDLSLGEPRFGPAHNPGITALWIAPDIEPFVPPDRSGVLFLLKEPSEVTWYTEGREATREEIVAAVEDALASLRIAAESQGPAAVRALEAMAAAAMRLLPPG